MNRRGFFKSLALLAGAASVSPQIFIPKFEPVRWKVINPQSYPFRAKELYGEWRWVSVRELARWHPEPMVKESAQAAIHSGTLHQHEFVYVTTLRPPEEKEIILEVTKQTSEDATVCVAPPWESDFMPELVSKDPSYWRSLGLDQ
jgi:hypothetical protein